jgi:hypothetical protein
VSADAAEARARFTRFWLAHASLFTLVGWGAIAGGGFLWLSPLPLAWARLRDMELHLDLVGRGLVAWGAMAVVAGVLQILRGTAILGGGPPRRGPLLFGLVVALLSGVLWPSTALLTLWGWGRLRPDEDG